MASALEQFFGGHKGATLYVNSLALASTRGDVNKSPLGQLMLAGNYENFSQNTDGAGNSQEAGDVHQDFVDFLVRAAKAHAEFDEVRGNTPELQSTLEQVKDNLSNVNLGAFVQSLFDEIFADDGAGNAQLRTFDLETTLSNNIGGRCTNNGSACRVFVLHNVDPSRFGAEPNTFYTEMGDKVNDAVRNIVRSAVDVWASDHRAKGGNGNHLLGAFKAQSMNVFPSAEVRDAILNVVQNAAKTTSGATRGRAAGRTLANADAKAMFMNVYGNWGDLSPSIRQFMSANLNVLAQPDSPYISAALDAARGPRTGVEVPLTVDEIQAIVADGAAQNPDRVRLNLKKTPDGTTTMFKASIPAAPVGNNFWVTTGSLGRGALANADAFRDIYQAAYTAYLAGGAGLGAVALSGVNAALNAATYNPSDVFNLNYALFLRNVQDIEDKVEAEKLDCQKTGQPQVGDCGEDLPNFMEFGDMAYGKTWNWDADEQTFFRMEGNNKIKYHEEVLGANNCYGTFLNGDGAKCKRVIDCLADGDHSNLATCMDVLQDQSMWDVAAEDVSKVNPSVVKTVLRKFHVQGIQLNDDQGKPYKVPMSFDQWREINLDGKIQEPARSAIKNNGKLLDYLKGLIAVCEANPAIINKRVPVVAKRGMYGTPGSATQFATRLNKRAYHDPRETESEYAIAAAQLRALPYGTLVPTLFSPKLGSLHNASFYSNQTAPALFGGAYSHPQTGGSAFGVGNRFLLTSGTRLGGQNLTLKDGSGNIFEGLFKAIDAGLSDMGVTMDPTDRSRIGAAIKKLREIEQKLIAIVRRLSIAVRIGETLGANHYAADRERAAPMSLENVRTNEGARQFMRGHVEELRDAYEALHGHYGNISTDLVSHIYPRYLDRCCENKEKKVTAGPKLVDLFSDCPDN